MISLFFVIFRAPDLALTQLVVETITTSLFLLCFYFLPKLRKEVERVRLRIGNLLIALGVGGTLTAIGLAAQGHRLFEPISYYFEESYTLAGARNMVNAILVDFRAFDTMIEIVVLFIAGAGVYTLIKLRQSEEGCQVKFTDTFCRQRRKSRMIILTFWIYVFFSGHHEPGGGFIGGLITSSAIVLLAMAFDVRTVRQISRLISN